MNEKKSVPVLPDFDYTVASPRHKSPDPSSGSLTFDPRLTRYQTSRLGGRRPTDSINSLSMRSEDLVCPISLLEF